MTNFTETIAPYMSNPTVANFSEIISALTSAIRNESDATRSHITALIDHKDELMENSTSQLRQDLLDAVENVFKPNMTKDSLREESEMIPDLMQHFREGLKSVAKSLRSNKGRSESVDVNVTNHQGNGIPYQRSVHPTTS